MVLAAPWLPLAAQAQEPAARGGAAKPGEARGEVLSAIALPQRAQALRDDWVKADDVKQALDASRKQGLHASEASDTLVAADEAVKANGPVDDFGAFVQSQLDAGLRGKDLAAAIRSEHEAHGKGKRAGKPEDKHGMTAAEFEKALFDIASDPEKSAAYQAAMQ